jgi:hypothetical protein
MRWIVCLLTILLSGCQGVSLLERHTAEVPPSIMPLWAHYQQCLVTTDPTELVLIIDQLERVMLAGAEPPSWMRAWGEHVTNQPLRTSVDPQALGAACTLRAAAVMAEAEHLTEARALYQRVLARYRARLGLLRDHRGAGAFRRCSYRVALRPDRPAPLIPHAIVRATTPRAPTGDAVESHDHAKYEVTMKTTIYWTVTQSPWRRIPSPPAGGSVRREPWNGGCAWNR